jgi:hypothetical protein
MTPTTSNTCLYTGSSDPYFPIREPERFPSSIITIGPEKGFGFTRAKVRQGYIEATQQLAVMQMLRRKRRSQKSLTRFVVRNEWDRNRAGVALLPRFP